MVEVENSMLSRRASFSQSQKESDPSPTSLQRIIGAALVATPFGIIAYAGVSLLWKESQKEPITRRESLFIAGSSLLGAAIGGLEPLDTIKPKK